MSDDKFHGLQTHVRDRCAFRPHDTPDYAAADELRALLVREAVAASPAQREELERLVRQGMGT